MLRNKEIGRLVLFLAAAGGSLVAVCFCAGLWTGLAALVLFTVTSLSFLMFTWRRYREIAQLSEELERILDGKEGLNLHGYEEGELSMLREELHKVTSRLSEETQTLKKKQSSLQDTLSDISHQLKTPLASLSLMGELLARPELPSGKREEFAQRFRMELSRMEWLVQSLLKMARLDAKESFCREEIRAEELAKLCLEGVASLLSSRNQLIRLEGKTDIRIRCDGNWTAEALVNVLKNASDYSGESAEIFVSWEENPLAVCMTIKDCGGGISDSDLPHLFERFYRGEKASGDSVGIGLAMAREIMRKQGGELELKNHPGIGTEFVFRFYREKPVK